MSRRRIVRPPAPPIPAVDHRRLEKLQVRLEDARRGFARWLSRLKRAFRAVEKQQGQIARLERQIQKLEET